MEYYQVTLPKKVVSRQLSIPKKTSDVDSTRVNFTKLLSVADSDQFNESLLYPLQLSDGSTKWVCMELIEKRLSLDGRLFEQSLKSENISGGDCDLILQFVYSDSMISTDYNLQGLIRVYSWSLKHTKVERFISLLQNTLINTINAGNVVSAVLCCEDLNNSRENFQRLIGHCYWIIHTYIKENRHSEVINMLQNPQLLMKIFSNSYSEFSNQIVPQSSFAIDILSLHNSSMGSIKCIVSENHAIKVVPAILAVSCEYFWNLLSGVWENTDKINLSEIGLDENQTSAASQSELVSRGNTFAKFIKYWHGGTISIENDELMDSLDIFKFLGLDSATDNPLYSQCLDRVLTDITVETILPLCSRFILDSELIGPKLSKVTERMITFVTKNWKKINMRYTIDEINYYCSKNLMRCILAKMSQLHQ
jgi:hypothetical protein